MAHIPIAMDLPGILGPLTFSPDTAKPLLELANQLLTVESEALTRAERELIASYVSYLNGCVYCFEAHGAVADSHQQMPGWARSIWHDGSLAKVSAKMKALLVIAGKVQSAPREVSSEDIERARFAKAGDREIHDTVLIAAAFSMYNRYVDGLATRQPPPRDPLYQERAKRIVDNGYVSKI
jgi:uncharacterized peroxidase-related enzyme